MIPAPEMLVAYGNDDNEESVDGNLATCLELSQKWCDVGMKVQ